MIEREQRRGPKLNGRAGTQVMNRQLSARPPNSWNLRVKETNDPIVAEGRAVRERQAAQFGYDVKEIFKNIRAQQKASGRNYVRYPARPASATTTSTSSE